MKAIVHLFCLILLHYIALTVRRCYSELSMLRRNIFIII